MRSTVDSKCLNFSQDFLKIRLILKKGLYPILISLEVTNQLCAYHMSKKAYNTNLCVYLRCDRIYVDISDEFELEFPELSRAEL